MKIFVKIAALLTALTAATKLSGGLFRDNDNPFPGFEAFDGGANNGKEVEEIADPPDSTPPTDADITPEEQAELDRIAALEQGKQEEQKEQEEQEKQEEQKGQDKSKSPDKSGFREERSTGDSIAAVKIGDKILSDEDMDKVRVKMEQKFGKERLEKMDEEELLVWTKEYVNILEGSKSINARFQEAAATERNIKAEQAAIEQEKEKIEKKAAEANNVLEEIKKRQAELEEVIKKQPKDIFNDDEVQDLKIEKALAEQENRKLTEQAGKISAFSDKIKQEEQEIYYELLINELQANIPDLQTQEKVPDILSKLADIDDTDPASLEQAQVAQRVKMVFNGYLAEVAKDPDTKLTITKYYKTIEQNLPQLKRSAAQTAKQTLTELKEGKLKEYYKKLAEKQKNTPPTPGYGGGSSHSTERIEEATDKTAADHWKSLGYNFDSL